MSDDTIQNIKGIFSWFSL